MDFDAWTNRTIDKERRKRLMIGYTFGLLATGAFVTALAVTSEAQEFVEEEEDNILDVQLAEEPEMEPEPEPEPEPETPQDPEPAPQTPQPQQPMLPQMVAPDEIPDSAPEEKDPAPDNPYASTDPSAYGVGQRGTAAPRVVKKVVKAAPAPKPVVKKPSGPVRITANTVPPKRLSGAAAVYPESARAAGIQGAVFVRFVVDINGNSTQVRAIRGPEALRASCVAGVKSTKWTPAKDKTTGKVIAVHKIKKCDFGLNAG